MKRLTTGQTKQLEIISRQLASLFPGESCGSCACLGIQCYNPSDSRWWYNFLIEVEGYDIERMVESYFVATGKR